MTTQPENPINPVNHPKMFKIFFKEYHSRVSYPGVSQKPGKKLPEIEANLTLIISGTVSM
jgi:hypothetical protein